MTFTTRLALAGMLAASAACASSGIARVSPERAAEADAAARRAIANERAIRADAIPMRTVGVTPLRVASSDTTLLPLSYGLADLLMTDLSRSAQVRIVDRLQLDAVLRELSLATTGRVDSSSAARVGRLVQARRLVVGGLTQRAGGQIGIDARVADVVSGQVRGAVSASASLNDILRAEKELAFRLLQEMNVTLTPAERAAIEQRPTGSFAALLAYSRGVQYEVQGRFDDAVGEFNRAAALDPEFAAAALRARAGLRRNQPQGLSQIARVGATATDRVNPTSPFALPRPGTVADVAFPAQTVTVIVTITARP